MEDKLKIILLQKRALGIMAQTQGAITDECGAWGKRAGPQGWSDKCPASGWYPKLLALLTDLHEAEGARGYFLSVSILEKPDEARMQNGPGVLFFLWEDTAWKKNVAANCRPGILNDGEKAVKIILYVSNVLSHMTRGLISLCNLTQSKNKTWWEVRSRLSC